MQGQYRIKREQFRKSLAEVVESLRSPKKKSANLISDEVDMSKTTWLKLEKGNLDPQLTTFCRIAEALEISPVELLDLVYKNLSPTYPKTLMLSQANSKQNSKY